MISSAAMSLARRRHGFESRFRHRTAASMRASDLHMFSQRDENAETNAQARMRALPTVRTYHTSSPMLYRGSPPLERSAVAVTLGLGAVAAGAYAASSVVKVYNEWQASRPVQTEEAHRPASKCRLPRHRCLPGLAVWARPPPSRMPRSHHRL